MPSPHPILDGERARVCIIGSWYESALFESGLPINLPRGMTSPIAPLSV